MTSPRHHFSRLQSFLIVILAYSAALFLGYISMSFFSGYSLLWQLFIADIVATIIVFAFSLAFSNSSIYDPYWSVIPPFITLFWMYHAPYEGNVNRQVLVLVIVTIWAARLTLNWARGWQGLHHEDWRYTDLAEKTGRLYWLVSFWGIHFFPTILVFLGCLPLMYCMESSKPLEIFDALAVFVTLGAVAIETIADEQLKTFKKKKGAELMKSGIWAFSRHPNYLGEILFWVGLFIFAMNHETNLYWASSIGFVSMVVLFVFISIPMMEKRMIAKRPEFAEYKKEVSMLFPLPSRSKSVN